MGEISTPELLNETHQIDLFKSGESTLDDWLARRALDNNKLGASRTFVVHEKQRVIGYYCLAAGSVEHQDAPGKVKRNMPNPIPVVVLGRLAVDEDWQNCGIGRGLLKDAVLRTLNLSQSIGLRAMLVHAISEEAKHFYKRFGFIESPLESMTLMLTLKEIRREKDQEAGILLTVDDI